MVSDVFVLADSMLELLCLEDAPDPILHLFVCQEVQLAGARFRVQAQTIELLRQTEQLFVG